MMCLYPPGIRLASALLLAVVIAQSGCAVEGVIWGLDSMSTAHSRWRFSEQTETINLTFDSRGSAGKARFSFQARLDKGALTWVLTDPTGAVRWHGNAVPGNRIEQSFSFAPIMGTWTLQLDLDGATGDYVASWSSP